MNVAEDIAKKIAQEKDDYIFNWLEKNNFKPQRTKEWVENFRNELENQGLFLRCETINQKNNLPDFDSQNYVYKTIETWICFIDRIDNPISLEELKERVGV